MFIYLFIYLYYLLFILFIIYNFRCIQQLDELRQAAKTLIESDVLFALLHLFLTCGNIICGDFNAQTIKGYRTSCILQVSFLVVQL